MAYPAAVTDDRSRKTIDTAIGVLVGLRGCTPEQAFAELVQVVRQTGIGIGTISSGLVAIASGSSSADDAEVFTVWGDLIARGRARALTVTR